MVASRVAGPVSWVSVATRTHGSTGITPGEVTSPDTTRVAWRLASRLRSRSVPGRTGRLRLFYGARAVVTVNTFSSFLSW